MAEVPQLSWPETEVWLTQSTAGWTQSTQANIIQFSSSMWLHKCMGAKAGAYIAHTHTHIAFIFQHSPRPVVLFKQHFRGFQQFPWTMIPQDSIGTSGPNFTGANRKLMQIEFQKKVRSQNDLTSRLQDVQRWAWLCCPLGATCASNVALALRPAIGAGPVCYARAMASQARFSAQHLAPRSCPAQGF